jgi:hypothetical protein
LSSKVEAKVEQANGKPFSIIDWSDYPKNVPKPDPEVRIVEGDEYKQNRQAANNENARIRRNEPAKVKNKQVHEIKPVKFGGDPVSSANKVVLPTKTHTNVSSWWQRLKKWATK